MEYVTKELEHALGYQFKQLQILERALTHRSFSSEHNERLEFLGDAILNFLIAEELWRKFPAGKEGELSRLRASLVNTDSLVDLATNFNLVKYLRLGPGELYGFGTKNRSILADAMEAVIAAIYVDAGFEVCRAIILGWYQLRLEKLTLTDLMKDPKTSLQEYAQARRLKLPEYKIEELRGETNAQEFIVSCKFSEHKQLTYGKGSSRRRAEQDAASKMLAILKNLV